MKTYLKWIAVAATVAAMAVVAPSASAQSAPYCGITWGSLDKSAGTLTPETLFNVRAGQHNCYDRLVFDVTDSYAGSAGYHVRYVTQVIEDPTGNVIPVRGGAFLQIALPVASNDPFTGAPTYTPANRNELVNVNGFRTFRQVVDAGAFEGYSSFGLGVRARLPFRVFTLDGPGGNSRVVIDVAHRW